MKVFVARVPGPENLNVNAPCETFEELARESKRHTVVGSPEGADLILFPQAHMMPDDWRLSAVRDHSLMRQFPGKVVVYDERDKPWAAVPGVYVSMVSRSFDWRVQRPWAYVNIQDPGVSSINPDVLYSLVASRSHRCRSDLFQLDDPDAVIEEVKNFTFYDPTSQDYDVRRKNFQEVLERSRFVLCPRGRGSSSIACTRLSQPAESPSLCPTNGRRLRARSGISSASGCPRRVGGTFQAIIRAADDRWPEMSAAAREAYNRFFTPARSFDRIIDLCAQTMHEWLPHRAPLQRRSGAYRAAGLDYARAMAITKFRQSARRTFTRQSLSDQSGVSALARVSADGLLACELCGAGRKRGKADRTVGFGMALPGICA